MAEDWWAVRARVSESSQETMDKVQKMSPRERIHVWNQYQTGDKSTRDRLEETAQALGIWLSLFGGFGGRVGNHNSSYTQTTYHTSGDQSRSKSKTPWWYEGVWGPVHYNEIQGITSKGMPVTHTYRALNAMEEIVCRYLPGFGETVRGFFDNLEIRANRNGLLYNAGPLIFSIMGEISEKSIGLLQRIGLVEQKIIESQYTDYIGDFPQGCRIDTYEGNPFSHLIGYLFNQSTLYFKTFVDSHISKNPIER